MSSSHAGTERAVAQQLIMGRLYWPAVLPRRQDGALLIGCFGPIAGLRLDRATRLIGFIHDLLSHVRIKLILTGLEDPRGSLYDLLYFCGLIR